MNATANKLEALLIRRPNLAEEPQGWERESDRTSERYAGSSYEYEMRNGQVIRFEESFEDLGVRQYTKQTTVHALILVLLRRVFGTRQYSWAGTSRAPALLNQGNFGINESWS